MNIRFQVLLAISFLFVAHINGQREEQRENNALNDLLAESIFIELGLDVPVKEIFPNYSYYKKSSDVNILEYLVLPQLSRSMDDEVKELLECLFIPKIENQNIVLSCRGKENLLFEIEHKQNKTNSESLIKTKNEQVNKRFLLNDGIIQNIHFKNAYRSYILEKDTLSSRLIQTTVLDSLAQKFEINDQIFENNLLSKLIVYKSAKNKNDLKVSRTQEYLYSEDDKLVVMLTKNNKGKVIDSTKYNYNEGLLQSIVNTEKETTSFVNYKYENNKLFKAQYKGPKYKVEYTYKYDADSRLRSMVRSDLKLQDKTKLVFAYDADDKLISIDSYGIPLYGNSKSLKLEANYNFIYSSSDIIQSVVITGVSGEVEEEIKIDYHIL